MNVQARPEVSRLVPSADDLLRLTPAAVYATDRSGKITFFNPAAATLWGIEPILGETMWCGSWRIFRPEGGDLPLDQCPMAVCLKEARPIVDAEIVVQRPDGTVRQVLVNPRPLFDEAGTLIGGMNTLLDITAKREAERARSQSERFAKHIVDNSHDCIKTLDADFRLRSINKCGCVSLEIDDPACAVGLSYLDFWKGDDRAKAQQAIQDARASGMGRFSATFESSSGRKTVWDEIITVLPEGEAAGSYLVVSRDMTQHSAMLGELARRHAQQKALADMGELALSDRKFEQFLQELIPMLAAAVDCELAKVLQFADSADHLRLRAGIGWKDGIVGKATVGIDHDSQAGFTLLTNGPVVVADLPTETRFNGPALLRDHGVRSGMSTPIPGVSGRPFGVLGVHTRHGRDFDAADVQFLCSVANVIAARWRQEEANARRNLLQREMAHRSGNLLQLANSIFLQTVKHSATLDEAKVKYNERLAAMARTNTTIARDGWSTGSIEALAREVMEPFLPRISFGGRDIVIPAELRFDLGLIFHELSTNSAKYGAFGGDAGSVHISWQIVSAEDGGEMLRIEWTDKTPATTNSRRGTGFGNILLSQLVERKHGGTLSATDSPIYRCRIDIPMAPARYPPAVTQRELAFPVAK